MAKSRYIIAKPFKRRSNYLESESFIAQIDVVRQKNHRDVAILQAQRRSLLQVQVDGRVENLVVIRLRVEMRNPAFRSDSAFQDETRGTRGVGA